MKATRGFRVVGLVLRSAASFAVLGLSLNASYLGQTGRASLQPTAAGITVYNTILGQTTKYVGATEAGVFRIEDLTDLGINTYRMWTKMAELEWWDDDDARAATPWMCTQIGTPSIAAIKADQASGFANTIPWDWWEEQFTGTYYTWSGHSREQVIQQCVNNGITPVLVLRNRDDANQPNNCGGNWAPDSPIDQGDLDEWWEHCFAIAYWLNVLHNYGLTRFEVLNEPDLSSQGWHGTQAEYVQLVQTAYDAIKFANDMVGLETVLHAPVVSNAGSGYIAYALDNADDEIAVVDYHTYANDPTASIATVRSTIAAHNPDGATEPIWLSEWGTYTSSYDTLSRAMLTAQQLMTFSEQQVEGVTIFGMYAWGPFSGLLDTSWNKTETYYAFRLMTRGLKGGKDRLQFTASNLGSDTRVMVTKGGDEVYVLVINASLTSIPDIQADLSALDVNDGTVQVYEYSSSNKDAIVATPTMTAGRFTFTAPADGIVLAVVKSSPTAVTLASFTATAHSESILLEWQTVSEIDTLGFNLYRSHTASGGYVRLNDTLIPGQALKPLAGAAYTWLDDNVKPGVMYYYELEDLGTYGQITSYGPVWAMAGLRHRLYLPLTAK
jgi:hypothetical protein